MLNYRLFFFQKRKKNNLPGAQYTRDEVAREMVVVIYSN